MFGIPSNTIKKAGEIASSVHETAKNLLSKKFLLNLGLYCGLSFGLGVAIESQKNPQDLNISNNSVTVPVERATTIPQNIFTQEGSILNKSYNETLGTIDQIKNEERYPLNVLILDWLRKNGVPETKLVNLAFDIVNTLNEYGIYTIYDIQNLGPEQSKNLQSAISNVLKRTVPSMALGFNQFFGAQQEIFENSAPAFFRPAKSHYTAFTRSDENISEINIPQIASNLEVKKYFNGLSQNVLTWAICYYLSIFTLLPFSNALSPRKAFTSIETDLSLSQTDIPDQKPNRLQILKEKIQDAKNLQKITKTGMDIIARLNHEPVTQTLTNKFEYLDEPVKIRFRE